MARSVSSQNLHLQKMLFVLRGQKDKDECIKKGGDHGILEAEKR